jgi:hypothetical protein
MQIARLNEAELGSDSMQKWQLNWEVQLCNIVRRLSRCKVQNWEVNWEVQRYKLGGSTVRNWQRERFRIGRRDAAEPGVQRFRSGRRIGRCNDAVLSG